MIALKITLQVWFWSLILFAAGIHEYLAWKTFFKIRADQRKRKSKS